MECRRLLQPERQQVLATELERSVVPPSQEAPSVVASAWVCQGDECLCGWARQERQLHLLGRP